MLYPFCNSGGCSCPDGFVSIVNETGNFCQDKASNEADPDDFDLERRNCLN